MHIALGFLGVLAFLFVKKSMRERDEDDDTTLKDEFLFDSGMDVMGTTGTKTATGYSKGQQIQVELAPIGGGLYLRTDVAQAFLRMKAAAAADEVELKPSGPRSAFRTTEQQLSLQIDRASFAAPVNHSNHQAGTCVDLETAQGTNDAYNWLIANGPDYGFHSTVSREPWHWEYI